jgi:ribose-phosphate pyrophosphokinase
MLTRDEQQSPPSNLVVLAGSANPALAEDVAHELGLELGRCTLERFPDGELHLQVDANEVDGRHVAIVQPTSTVASERLFELLLAVDACRHAGAMSISAVIPYFGYARQDRRTKRGEALGARVAAKALDASGLDHVVAVDVHSETVQASFDIMAEQLSAVPLLADALEELAGRDSVVVAPDFGAVRLAREYARILRLPYAVVHKVRTSATQVSVDGVAGNVRDLRPIIVDDIISTGGTLAAAARAVREQGCRNDILVAATHALFVPGALARLGAAGLTRVFVTDTVARTEEDPSITTISVAPLIASAIRRHVARRLHAQYMLHP